ncbi:MAG: cobalamin-dependent protein [Candidatus Hydrogenedentales bacterium]|jgi:methanogenic corrinoid protein MtbC1
MDQAALLEKTFTEYYEAVFDTDRERALTVTREAVANGLAPEDVVFKIVMPAIDKMVKSISENFDTNLAQHFMASQIASAVADEMIAKFRTQPQATGRVVIGTSPGDFHGLGKSIVSGCLRSLMIDVVDLGCNVPPERFVDEAVACEAQVIGISSMMLHTARGENGCLGVRKILRQRSLEDRIKVIVGGAPYRFDPELYRTVEADAWANDGLSAGEAVVRLIGTVKT